MARERERGPLRLPVGRLEQLLLAAFNGVRLFGALADHQIHRGEMALAQVLHRDELLLVFAV